MYSLCPPDEHVFCVGLGDVCLFGLRLSLEWNDCSLTAFALSATYTLLFTVNNLIERAAERRGWYSCCVVADTVVLYHNASILSNILYFGGVNRSLSL